MFTASLSSPDTESIIKCSETYYARFLCNNIIPIPEGHWGVLYLCGDVPLGIKQSIILPWLHGWHGASSQASMMQVLMCYSPRHNGKFHAMHGYYNSRASKTWKMKVLFFTTKLSHLWIPFTVMARASLLFIFKCKWFRVVDVLCNLFRDTTIYHNR